jgi:hypothetical protein
MVGMPRTISKLGIICGVAGVILIFFILVFSLFLTINDILLYLSLGLGIAACILGIISIFFVDGGAGFGAGAIVLAIVIFLVYWLITVL